MSLRPPAIPLLEIDSGGLLESISSPGGACWRRSRFGWRSERVCVCLGHFGRVFIREWKWSSQPRGRRVVRPAPPRPGPGAGSLSPSPSSRGWAARRSGPGCRPSRGGCQRRRDGRRAGHGRLGGSYPAAARGRVPSEDGPCPLPVRCTGSVQPTATRALVDTSVSTSPQLEAGDPDVEALEPGQGDGAWPAAEGHSPATGAVVLTTARRSNPDTTLVRCCVRTTSGVCARTTPPGGPVGHPGCWVREVGTYVILRRSPPQGGGSPKPVACARRKHLWCAAHLGRGVESWAGSFAVHRFVFGALRQRVRCAGVSGRSPFCTLAREDDGVV